MIILLAVIGTVTCSLTSLLELLVPKDLHAEHLSVKLHGGSPGAGHLKHPVQCLSCAHCESGKNNISLELAHHLKHLGDTLMRTIAA